MTGSYPRDAIVIHGASEHNLKNLDVTLPRGAITAITGVSGAGKSSLAFDTVLSESYRKFFFTLSHYFRQFLPTKEKAKVKKITGLSPAIGLSQYETRPSPYASVASITDLGELFGVMFAKYADTFCPKHGLATQALSQEEVSKQISRNYQGTMIALCSPFVQSKKGHFRKKLEGLREKGFLKILCDGEILSLSPTPELDPEKKHTIKVIVDTLEVKGASKRLDKSLKTAFDLSDGYVEAIPCDRKGGLEEQERKTFSNKAGCPSCGYSWPKLDSRYFAANSLGRCSCCNGLGRLEEHETEKYRGELGEACDTCRGTGISSDKSSIKVKDHNIHDLYHLTISEVDQFLQSLTPKHAAEERLLGEMRKGLSGLIKMGLGYLHLFRKITSLSLGEHQRARLSSVLSQDMSGIIYVLDEPSQGLHPSEIENLYQVLLELKSKGNTLILVDHDPYLLKRADWIIDLGPVGGKKGGHKLAEFKPKDAARYRETSLTASSVFLNGETPFAKVKSSREDEFINIHGASCHNLKIPKVSFRKKALNVVSGVSGAGKTSLVIHTLYSNLQHYVYEETLKKKDLMHCSKIEGFQDISECYLINRMPLAKTSASLVVTYLGLFTMIRELFASSPEAKIAGLLPKDFSLRTGDGRCSECQGKGFRTLEMKFLEDVQVECPLCQGKRYKLNILSVRYNDKNMSEILDLSVDEAYKFFHFHRKIKTILKACQNIGLGYLKLGQPSTQFSGGEAQRLKIVSTFLKAKKENQLLVLDEPTRGLHECDITYLVKFLRELTDSGSTVVVIEHHTGLIKEADWLVDLGPGAAEDGGTLLYEGKPQGVLLYKEKSPTAQYL